MTRRSPGLPLATVPSTDAAGSGVAEPTLARSDLAEATARGAASTAVGQLIRIGTQVLSIVVLARLLTPQDFGYVAVVAALIGLADVVRDFGLGTAAVQARTLTRTQASNLFYLNCGLGLVLAAAGWAAAPAVAGMYGEPVLQPIVQALSLVLVLNGVASQFRASLYRELRYARVAASDVIGQVAALVVGVGCALAGLGYWSLVLAELARAACMCVVLTRNATWRPGRPGRAPMRPLVRFGVPVVTAQLVNQAARSADRLIVGFVFGTSVAGVYGRASQLLTLPLAQVVGSACKVALPVLSRLQDDVQQLSVYLRRIQLVLANVTTAILLLMAAAAGPVVEVVLGEQWSDVVPLIRILCVAGVFQALADPAQWVLTAAGRTARALTLAVLGAVLLVGGLWFGSGFTVTGTAVGYVCAQVLIFGTSLLWLRLTGLVAVGPLLGVSCRALAAHGAAAAAAWLVVSRCSDLVPAVVALIIGGATFLSALVVVVALWPAFRRDAAECRRALRVLR